MGTKQIDGTSDVTSTSTVNNGGSWGVPYYESIPTVRTIQNNVKQIDGTSNVTTISTLNDGGVFLGGLPNENIPTTFNVDQSNRLNNTTPIETTLSTISNFPLVEKESSAPLYSQKIKTTRTASAIRNGHFNKLTGEFDNGYPETNTEYWSMLDWRRVGTEYRWEAFQRSIENTISSATVNDTFHNDGDGIPDGFLGSVNLPDGRVFGIPIRAEHPIIFDPSSNTYTESSVTFPADHAYYAGGCLLHDGRVFLCPYNSTTALIYDPKTDTATVPNGTYPGGSKYFLCVLMEDGNVFIVPRRVPNPLIYNPYTDELITVPVESDIPSQPGCRGGVLLKNGNVFCAPYAGAYGYIYDKKQKTFRQASPSFSGLAGATLLPDGKIFMSPTNSPYQGCIYDPDTDTKTLTTAFSGLTGSYNYVGGCLMPNGKVFCAPWNATQAAIYDPIQDTITYTGSTLGGAEYNDATLMSDGRVISFPDGQTSSPGALIYGGGSAFDINVILSSYHNAGN